MLAIWSPWEHTSHPVGLVYVHIKQEWVHMEAWRVSRTESGSASSRVAQVQAAKSSVFVCWLQELLADCTHSAAAAKVAKDVTIKELQAELEQVRSALHHLTALPKG